MTTQSKREKLEYMRDGKITCNDYDHDCTGCPVLSICRHTCTDVERKAGLLLAEMDLEDAKARIKELEDKIK